MASSRPKLGKENFDIWEIVQLCRPDGPEEWPLQCSMLV